MTSPLTDASASAQVSPFPSLSGRQRLESMLGNLPPTGGVVAQSAPAGAEATSRDSLVEPIQRINEVMRPYGVEFELSDETSRLVTRIVDRDSGEVIRQIPAEEMLRIAERLDGLQGRLIQLEA